MINSHNRSGAYSGDETAGGILYTFYWNFCKVLTLSSRNNRINIRYYNIRHTKLSNRLWILVHMVITVKVLTMLLLSRLLKQLLPLAILLD